MSEPLANIPVHLITGFLGSGKSTLIHHLIEQKPPGERWAVLINEFGQVGIDQAMFETRDDLVVKGMPGGCLCCQLAFVLQATLVNLLHRHRPDRVIVEPSGLGHPAGLLEVLRGEAFAEVLDVRSIVALLDPRRLDDPRAREHETFRDQIAMADGVALTMTDLATQAQRDAAGEWLADFWPPKRWVLDAPGGALPLEQLIDGEGEHTEGEHGERGAVSREPLDSEAHRRLREAAGNVLAPGAFDSPLPERGRPRCETGGALGHDTLGWRWHPLDIFDLDRLANVLAELPSSLRVKGVFATDVGWKLYNRADGVLTLTDSAWRRDSRLEVIGETGSLPDAQGLEAALAACLMNPA